MALYQKYRSQKFSELLGQTHVGETLKEAVKSDKIVHAYLFTGPRGIGKTSSARILARAINCRENNDGEPCNNCDSCKEIIEGSSIDITEIDAASHTGVDDIREIIERARLLPAKAKKKVYIIDEVHMLSKSAFNALLKTLEEPPAHVVFIMATTEVQKIPATILSRAQRYDFKRATKEDIVKNLKSVAKAEKIEADEESIELIALLAEGGHRDSLSLFEQVASLSSKVTIEDTRNILGIPRGEEVYQFLGAIFNKNPEEGLKIAHDIYRDGGTLVEFNKYIIEQLRKALLFKISGKFLFEDTKENQKNVEKIASISELSEIQKALAVFIEAGNLLKDVSFPLLPIEMAVVELCQESISAKQVVKSTPDEKPKITKSEFHLPRHAEDETGISNQTPNPKSQDQNSNPIPVVDSGHPEPQDLKPKPQDPSPTVAIPVLEMTDGDWNQVVNKIKGENASLAALLKDAKPINVSDGSVVLGVKFSFHKDRISDPKNSVILEKAIADIMGNSCKVECTIADLKPKPEKPVDPGELEKAVDEIFE